MLAMMLISVGTIRRGLLLGSRDGGYMVRYTGGGGNGASVTDELIKVSREQSARYSSFLSRQVAL